MSEEEQFEAKEESDDVEAHKRRAALSEEPAQTEDDESDDVEAHRRRA